MWFLRRLWHVLTFSDVSPLAAPAPAAAQATSAATQPEPPRYRYRSREEVEVALLLSWLSEAERPRFVERLLPKARKYLPWSEQRLEGEPWEQCQEWGPLVIRQPEALSIEGFCRMLEAELVIGLQTYCTSLEALSRPVRMFWLWRQGRRAGQVYAALEQALGNHGQAVSYAWWVVAGL